MIFCQKNFYHAQEHQKWAHDKGVKSKSHIRSEKLLLNSKYIKTKQNLKLKAKFFEPFRVLHSVRKQAYKLELFRKWKIYDVFYVSPLEQNTTRRGQVEKKIRQIEFDIGNNSGEYEVEAI